MNTQETMATIADVYKRSGYIVDPHTAVGIAASQRFRVEGTDGVSRHGASGEVSGVGRRAP